MNIGLMGARIALNSAAHSNRVAASRLHSRSRGGYVGGFSSTEDEEEDKPNKPMGYDEYNKEMDKTDKTIDSLIGFIVIGLTLLVGICGMCLIIVGLK
jgi:hypothetical protein